MSENIPTKLIVGENGDPVAINSTDFNSDIHTEWTPGENDAAITIPVAPPHEPYTAHAAPPLFFPPAVPVAAPTPALAPQRKVINEGKGEAKRFFVVDASTGEKLGEADKLDPAG